MKEEKKDDGEIAEELEKPYRLWIWSMASVIFRFSLIFFPENFNLSSRPELSTPLTSLLRHTVSISISLSRSLSLHHLQFRLHFSVCFECSVAEGYWLKQSSMLFAGYMYHGSPLLLSVLGPLTVQRIEGQWNHHLCSLVFVIADILSAVLLRAIGQKLQMAYRLNLRRLGVRIGGVLPCGDIAALVYLWNPFTILSCAGFSTSPIENLAIIVSLWSSYSTSSSGCIWVFCTVQWALFIWVSIASHNDKDQRRRGVLENLSPLIRMNRSPIYITQAWRNPKCRGKLPPGSMGLPLLGETIQFFKPNTTSDIPPFVKERVKKYGPIFKTSLLGRPVIVSTDPDLSYFVFQQEGRCFQSWGKQCGFTTWVYVQVP